MTSSASNYLVRLFFGYTSDTNGASSARGDLDRLFFSTVEKFDYIYMYIFTVECSESEFDCGRSVETSKRCIEQTFVCDGQPDCPDKRDERDCSEWIISLSQLSSPLQVSPLSSSLSHYISSLVLSIAFGRLVCI